MKRGTAVSYRVFVRNWWRWEENRLSSGRHLVPDPGARKTTIATGMTESEAQAFAQGYNNTNELGALSRKAEYEEE